MNSVTIPLLETNPPPLLPGKCEKCECLPEKMHGPGLLLLRFPLSHSLGKMLQFLRKEEIPFSQDKGTLSVYIADADLAPFAYRLSTVLSSTEQRDIHAIFQQEGQVLELADYLDAQSLGVFLGRAQTSWLIDMMQQERLSNHFQPIIEAKTGEIFAYESLLRGVDGDKLISPLRLFDVANNGGMAFQLDLAARRSAIRNAAIYGISQKVFINFTPTAIYDPIYCLRSTVDLIAQCGLQNDQVVFEVVESAQVEDSMHLTKILDFYRERGFGVALDDLGAGYSSLNLLSALRPDYVKLDRELVAGVHMDQYKAVITSKMLETARDLGVKTIAEGIETRDEQLWLTENEVDYMQGYFFARPALPPPTPNFQP